jgi:hypothetical protein
MGEGMGVGVREHVRAVVWREVTVVYDRIWKRYDSLRSGMLRIRSNTCHIRSVYDLRISPYISVYGHGQIRS